MTYYLVFTDDNSHIEIGESSFKNFWCAEGFKVLTRIVNEEPEAISHIIIKQDDGKEIEITKFLDKIGKLTLIMK